MKLNVYGLDGKVVKTIDFPDTIMDYRKDLVRRAYFSFMNSIRQPYGSDTLAGKRTSASYRGRRRDYGTWANRAMHRTKRIRIGSGYLTGRARFVPHAVKGRRAHPPKVEKIWEQKINKKEKRKAILSAIVGTFSKQLVELRGHRVKDIRSLPIVVVDDFSHISRTKEVIEFLTKLGMEEELERVKEKKIRAGRGKMRGRRYKKKVGPLIVLDNKESELVKAASNVPGVEVKPINSLNIKDLSPSGDYPRLTIYTESAMSRLKEMLMS